MNRFGFSRGNIIVLVVVSILIITCSTLYFMFVPSIKLNGNKVVTINYKEKYREEGYKATLFNKDISKNVKVTGNVDSNKIGDYKITYTVRDKFKRKVVRTVKVRDTSKPVFNQDIPSTIYACPNKEYEMNNISAYDNYDGDISKSISIKKGKGTIKFTVTDSNGNTNTIKRKLVYKDNIKPTVELNGSSYIYLYVGDKYNELGVTSSDNCDSKLDVKIDSDVDTSKSGKYKVTYTVTDSSGNKSSVIRNVIVSVKDDKSIIYLTFDDGPLMGTTNVILDILKEEGVPATFFVTGKGEDSLIKREFEEGHSVVLHTWSHDYSDVYASIDNYYKDLNKISDRVYRITGERSHIIRFPGGSSNTVSRRYTPHIMSYLSKDVVDKGYIYFDWNISSGDAAGRPITSLQVKNNVCNGLRHNRANVVLMHDIKPFTRDAIRDIIRYGKENGYTFKAITMDTPMVRHGINN